MRDQPVKTWAGFWQDMPDVGPVFAGMTMTANAAIPPTNGRMSVLLEHGEIDQWLHGPIGDMLAFQFREPLAGSRMKVLRMTERLSAAPCDAAHPAPSG